MVVGAGATAVDVLVVDEGAPAFVVVGFWSVDANKEVALGASVSLEVLLSVVLAVELSGRGCSAVFTGVSDAPQPAIIALVPRAARVS